MKNNVILVIGENGYGELGLKTTNDALELVKFYDYNHDKYINSIHSGRFFTIFADIHTQHYFSVGYNLSGQCGVNSFELLVRELKFIEYFNENNIAIKYIRTSANGYNTFWITDTNKIYAMGPNRRNQLGLSQQQAEEDIIIPTLCDDLESKCIDIQCSYGYNIALCTSLKTIGLHIVSFYCERHNSEITQAIIHLIVAYCAQNEVYSVGKCMFGGNTQSKDVRVWTKVDYFEEIQIQKIATGANHSLFLDINGNLYSSGRNDFGQLGIGSVTKCKDPIDGRNDVQIISFFKDSNIKIVDIDCGWFHNLAIDESQNVWCWGENAFGQCSDNWFPNHVLTPHHINFFKENNIKIKQIQCGSNHSLIQTVNDKYFMFGDNEFNQCITFDNTMRVTQPFCINDTVENMSNGRKIKQISLGCGNTKLILQ